MGVEARVLHFKDGGGVHKPKNAVSHWMPEKKDINFLLEPLDGMQCLCCILLDTPRWHGFSLSLPKSHVSNHQF